METYNSSPLFDNYDECDLEVDEQQIIYFPPESSVRQENVSVDFENFISLSFHDPVVVWLEYFLQEVQNVAAFCVQPNFSSKHKLPIHSLLQKNYYLFIPSFSSKQGMLSNPLFAWLH